MLERFLTRVSFAGAEVALFFWGMAVYLLESIVFSVLVEAASLYLFLCLIHTLRLHGWPAKFPRKGKYWSDMLIM